MAETTVKASKGVFAATVTSNRQIGRRFYRLGLDLKSPAADMFANYKAGQFVQMDLSTTALPAAEAIAEEFRDAASKKIILRRPFSFADFTVKPGKASGEILYCVVGPSTVRMTTLRGGDTVSIIGPLGNGFTFPAGKKLAILVSGGIGTGPLIHLAKVLTSNHSGVEPIAFAGAKTKEDLPFEGKLDRIAQDLGFSLGEYARYGIRSQVATDDGSVGFAGLVTDCMAEWVKQNNPNSKETIIYSCGPTAMLERIAKAAAERNIDCQLSMEEMMACGIGVCQCCAVGCRGANPNETIYKLCCKDGPVFEGKDLVFSV
jgi:dihydroorotate dehydrogenase electron transfer subunit